MQKKQINLLNIHPGDINCPGRQPLIKSYKSHNYGIFCHEVTSKIDDTKNILYKFCLHTKNQQVGIDFIKNKTEYTARIEVNHGIF